MQRLEVISKSFLALAATVFLLISGVVAPLAGILLIPFVPQPALFFGLKYGIGWGVGVLFSAIVLCLIFAGEELAFFYSIFALMVGLLFWLLGRLRSIEFLVMGVAATMLTAAAGWLLYFFGSWNAMMQDFRGGLVINLSAAVRVQEKMGFPQDSLDLLKERTPEIIERVLQLLPALLFVSLCLIVLINILFLCRRFPDRWTQWFSVETLREWKGPEHWVWGLIACGFALFIPGIESIKTVAVNVLLIIGASYFLQGLAIVAYFFHKNNVPRYLRGVTYVLIVFQQIFTLLIAALGLFDLWGDFRRLKKKDLNPSQAS